MSPLTIVIIVVVIVLIFILLRYMIVNPNLLQNTQNAQTASTIEASSLATNGTNVPSSNFAYSIWIYINDWNYRYGHQKVIFGRMGAPSAAGQGDVPGLSGLGPCPAVVLGDVENTVSISLGCYPGVDQSPTTPGGNTVIKTCSVANIPIQRWVNITMSVYGRTLDTYIDGKLVRTCLLPGVASVNNNANIYVTPAGGFSGTTSKLQYFPNSLNPQDAWNIYTQGPTSWLNMFNSMQIQISLVENGNTQGSVTI